MSLVGGGCLPPSYAIDARGLATVVRLAWLPSWERVREVHPRDTQSLTRVAIAMTSPIPYDLATLDSVLA